MVLCVKIAENDTESISEIASIELQNRYLRINLSSGKVLRLRMKLSQMFEEVQRAYMEFCRKEARK